MSHHILFFLLLVLGLFACKKQSLNPADLNLNVQIDSAKGSVALRGTDTFLVHLYYFDSLDAVPLSYRLVPGAKLGSGAPVDTVYRPEPNSANVWHEKVDLSGNGVHSLTLTTADGRTARYFVALDYIIENKPFKYQTNALFFKGDSLYAATMDNGLFLSTDQAATFQPISGLGAQRVNCVYARGNTIYAGVTTGLAVSADAGRSWSTHVFEAPFNGYPYGMVNAVAVQGDSIYAANFDGVYISGDGGGSFKRVAKGTFAKGGPENMSCITAGGNVVYAGMTGGFFQSFDGGRNWATDGSLQNPGGSSFITCNSLLLQDKILYVGFLNGLGISRDGGVFTNRLPVRPTNAVAAGGSLVGGAIDGGYAVSRDGGNSYSIWRGPTGFGDGIGTAAAVSGNTLYFGFYGGGITTVTPR